MDTNTTRQGLRLQAIVALGGKCTRCGIDDPDVLDIHHTLNDGKSDRKARSVHKSWLDIIKGIGREFFEVLCANCHRRHHKMFPVNRRTRSKNPKIRNIAERLLALNDPNHIPKIVLEDKVPFEYGRKRGPYVNKGMAKKHRGFYELTAEAIKKCEQLENPQNR